MFYLFICLYFILIINKYDTRWFITTALKPFVDLVSSSAKVHLIVTGRGWGDGWGLLNLKSETSTIPVTFMEVENVVETLLKCNAVIVPDIATSSGFTTKVFDPVTYGVPFVATNLAKRGIICPHEANCDSLFFCPQDDHEGLCFANRLFAVVSDPDFVKQQQTALKTLRSVNGYQRWKSRPTFQSFVNDHIRFANESASV